MVYSFCAFFKFATLYCKDSRDFSSDCKFKFIKCDSQYKKSAKSYLKSNNLELKDMILFTSRRIKSNESFQW